MKAQGFSRWIKGNTSVFLRVCVCVCVCVCVRVCLQLCVYTYACMHILGFI